MWQNGSLSFEGFDSCWKVETLELRTVRKISEHHSVVGYESVMLRADDGHPHNDDSANAHSEDGKPQ